MLQKLMTAPYMGQWIYPPTGWKGPTEDVIQSILMIASFLTIPLVVAAEYGALPSIGPADCDFLRTRVLQKCEQGALKESFPLRDNLKSKTVLRFHEQMQHTSTSIQILIFFPQV